MMMNWLEGLRKRPEEERFAFAVMGAGAVALVLFLGWGAFFFNNSLSVGGDVQKRSAEVGQEATAVRAIELRHAFDEVVAQYQGTKEILGGTSVSENDATTDTVDTVVEITVTRSGAVDVENAIVGPSPITNN